MAVIIGAYDVADTPICWLNGVVIWASADNFMNGEPMALLLTVSLIFGS
jgi:uncharacterized membrane protein